MAITEIASLSTVKQYMRIPNPTVANTDDATIQMLMDAAQKVCERELGVIVARTVRAERHDGGKCELWLREIPVLYIENVQEGWGYYNWDLDDQEINSIPALSIWSYSLDQPTEGLITRRAAGNVLFPFVNGRNNIRVDYVAGRTEVPANATLAFCELVSIWYRQSQLRMTQGGPAQVQFNALNQDFTRATGDSSINLGVPDSIIEMLKPDRRRPIIG
jgi:hypothetical protein